MADQEFSNNVFINSPFDTHYTEIFRAIVFAVFDCGFVPRCALEYDDGGQVRIEKIYRLISDCKYGIHDISRTELDDQDLPRFNMPLELGIFLGAKRFGSEQDNNKTCMIIDKEKYRFQKFISDIAGQDIKSHDNNHENAIQKVRDWLRTASRRRTIPGGAEIIRRYGLFKELLPELCTESRITAEELTFNDYCQFVSEWLKTNP
jgi:hypothetical protein